MGGLAVVTPSYAPDYELACDLHRSVVRFTDNSVIHHIVTPDKDKRMFSTLAGPRCELWTVSDLLPRRFIGLPGVNAWMNVRRPFPPLRGWVAQQLVKLAMANVLDVDYFLTVDSDVVLIRPVTLEPLVREGIAHLYRLDGAVDEQLPRHLEWHRRAHRLLGLPAPEPPRPDYISSFNIWTRKVVLALQERIRQTTGRHWCEAVAAELHMSEFILYGVFVDRVLGPPANSFAGATSFCHSYWNAAPLDVTSARAFVHACEPTDLAVMLSAKSRTPLSVRRAALSTLDSDHR